MGIYSVKPKFQKILKPVENTLVGWQVHPTVINLSGLIASLITALLIYDSPQYPYILLLLPITTTIRTACNALDGLVARRLEIDSSFGEVLNEFIDRVSDILIFGSLILLDSTNNTLATITLLVILLNSYLSIVSKAAGGPRQYGGVMGKADRMIYISIAAVAVVVTGNTGIWSIFLVFTLIGTSITLIQRFVSTSRDLA